jgi:hypothetical protein
MSVVFMGGFGFSDLLHARRSRRRDLRRRRIEREIEFDRRSDVGLRLDAILRRRAAPRSPKELS